MSLDRAIVLMEEEVADFQNGTASAPKEGTAEWFLLRAKALGLSQLRRMKQLEVGDNPAAAERFYRGCAVTFKKLTVPDPVEIPTPADPDPLGVTSG